MHMRQLAHKIFGQQLETSVYLLDVTIPLEMMTSATEGEKTCHCQFHAKCMMDCYHICSHAICPDSLMHVYNNIHCYALVTILVVCCALL